LGDIILLNINPKSSKELEFEIEVQNINPSELEGRMRFIVDEVEYGIPVHITSGYISVDIPPLTEIIKRPLKNGEVISAKLDVCGEGFYLCPWNGDFKIISPVSVEAKLMNERSTPEIKVKEKEIKQNKKMIVKEEIKPKSKSIKDIVVTERMVELALNKLNITNASIREKVLEDAKVKVASKYGEITPKNVLKEILINYGKKKVIS
jgi:hypothetical protein